MWFVVDIVALARFLEGEFGGGDVRLLSRSAVVVVQTLVVYIRSLSLCPSFFLPVSPQSTSNYHPHDNTEKLLFSAASISKSMLFNNLNPTTVQGTVWTPLRQLIATATARELYRTRENVLTMTAGTAW
jgi:hypothetical protein